MSVRMGIFRAVIGAIIIVSLLIAAQVWWILLHMAALVGGS